MRPIRFRAWDSTRKIMATCQAVYSSRRVIANGESWEGDDIDVMQYTGLKDKSGKEIYEGDILEYNQGLFGELAKLKERNIVKWESGGFRIKTSYLAIITERLPNGLGFDPMVIGNKYENPELLSATKEI